MFRNQDKKTIPTGKSKPGQGNFYLNKWFLDFIGNNGEAMIFYAAILQWNRWKVSYSSWLNFDPASGVSQKSRFRNVQMPDKNNNLITWADPKFEVSGIWQQKSPSVSTRLFESEEGYLDWTSHQPASNVTIKYKERSVEGRGYVEQLILTTPPWKIPMNELRWGRFGSSENQLVWIEIKERINRHWLWHNGEKIENCIIEDAQISMPQNNMILKLDKTIILESENKISSIAEKLIPYIPGLNKSIPLKYLMAKERKCLSNGTLFRHGEIVCNGMAIHEFVDFK